MQKSEIQKEGKVSFTQKRLKFKNILTFMSPILAVLCAFIIAGFVVIISGGDPIDAYSNLFKGAFGSIAGLQNTIRYTLPIILLAFSFSICNLCGYFNIGQDGQIIAASLAVVWITVLFPKASTNIQLIIMIFTAALVGGITSLIPALFKIWMGINEVIIAILMNFILALLSSYQTVYSAIANTNASNPMTVVIQPRIEPVITIMAVIIIVIGYSLSLQKTVPGFQLRMVGKNSRFAQISGINSSRVIISAALIGGALSGLVAAGEILGVYHILYDGYAAGMGNNGIIAGLIGQNTPIGMILSSLVLGSLQSGSVLLSVNTNVPIQIIQVVQGFVMLFATINFVTLLIRPRLRRNA